MAQFNEVINTNLFSAFCAVKAAVKVMSKQSPKGGSIVLCSSAGLFITDNVLCEKNKMK
jgi:NAD(P)-dependent dehydrogenase (short-subunit alcohol dehydrogenase family)